MLVEVSPALFEVLDELLFAIANLIEVLL